MLILNSVETESDCLKDLLDGQDLSSSGAWEILIPDTFETETGTFCNCLDSYPGNCTFVLYGFQLALTLLSRLTQTFVVIVTCGRCLPPEAQAGRPRFRWVQLASTAS